MNDSLEELSKFVSYVLRHKPEAIGLQLDVEGWASIDALVKGAEEAGKEISYEVITSIVLHSDKKRFEISVSGESIRAVQGHSSESVERKYSELEPPEFLYHGTATRFLDSIRKEGLLQRARHHVHLTENEALARDVGLRYGKPVVLRIKSNRMFLSGFKFFRAENNVWLTLTVPPEFIDLSD
jgi:putative RNA 2'-phosphotransferase